MGIDGLDPRSFWVDGDFRPFGAEDEGNGYRWGRSGVRASSTSSNCGFCFSFSRFLRSPANGFCIGILMLS